MGGLSVVPLIGISGYSTRDGKVDATGGTTNARGIDVRFGDYKGIGWLSNGCCKGIGTEVCIGNDHGVGSGAKSTYVLGTSGSAPTVGIGGSTTRYAKVNSSGSKSVTKHILVGFREEDWGG